jgi:cytochrome c553
MNPRLKIFPVSVGLLVMGLGTLRAEIPAWAYAVNPAGSQPVVDDGRVKHVPDSVAGFTHQQIIAITVQPPDWHPEEHPAMPGIVGRSREPQVYACAYCHLPNGAGRPENASLAGLTPGYILSQMTAFREGRRPGTESRRLPQSLMISLAQALTETELAEAAAYFAGLKPVAYVKVVESEIVPKTVVAGWMLAKAPDGGTELIGNRIIEIAEDFEHFENRDSRTPYLAYVPRGSLRRGAALASTGGEGRTLLCITCHGPELKGLADVPRLAGRSPSYLFRQLYDLRQGRRTGGAAELMKPVVANLTDEDMVDLAAYLASREP